MESSMLYWETHQLLDTLTTNHDISAYSTKKRRVSKMLDLQLLKNTK